MKPWPCPRLLTLLNLFTQQQPKIYKLNRYKQEFLAIEERYVTHSFPFRFLTTLLGITFANAYEWFKYFVSDKECFLSFMRRLASDAVHIHLGYRALVK
eukprot:6175974-Pleurochrysis_carterae.AAC.1